MKNKTFLEGLRDGFPIGLGYFAVAFSLGIIAKNAGLTPLQGFIASFFNVASAGEYALFTSIQQHASLVEIAVITLVVNARYLLMSCALSQRFNTKTHLIHRFLVGFGVTDEIFGITIARSGFIKPAYNYGAMLIAVPLWSIGTSLGIIAGNFFAGTHCQCAFSSALWNVPRSHHPAFKKKYCHHDFYPDKLCFELCLYNSPVCKNPFRRNKDNRSYSCNFKPYRNYQTDKKRR